MIDERTSIALRFNLNGRSVDEVRRSIDEFIEAGVHHFELKIIYPDMESLLEQMALWSKEINSRYA